MTIEGEVTDDERICVRVRFFAAPKDALGQDRVELEVCPGTTVRELLDLLVARYPVLSSYVRFVSVAVNRAYVGLSTELHDGDEVACLPPVGGGSAASECWNSALPRSHPDPRSRPANAPHRERAW